MTVEEALEYQADGWAVIPLRIDKTPYLPKGTHERYLERAATEEEVRDMWKKFPNANVGLACGKVSGRTVVDIDDGEDVFPATRTVLTPTGGVHKIYKYSPHIKNSVSSYYPGIDTRNDKGYIVAAGSHCEYVKKGKKIVGNYVIIDDSPIREFPEDLFHIKQRSEGFDAKKLMGASEGSRNNDAASVIGALVSGKPKSIQVPLWELAKSWNSRCNPPLDEQELLTVFNSITEREWSKPTENIKLVDGLKLTKRGRDHIIEIPLPNGKVFFKFSEIIRSRQSFESVLTIQMRLEKEGLLPAFEQRIDLNSSSAVRNLATDLNSAYGNKKDGYNWVLLLNRAGLAIKKHIDQEKKPLVLAADSPYLKSTYLVEHFLEEGSPTLIHGDGSCFADGTPVLLSDGTYKPIENIVIGEKVATWNGEHIGIGQVSQTRRQLHVPKPMIELVYEYSNTEKEKKIESIRATYDHPFWDGERYYPLYQLAWGNMEESQRVQLKLLCEQYGQDFNNSLERGISHRDIKTWERPNRSSANSHERENSKGTPCCSNYMDTKSTESSCNKSQGRKSEEQRDNKPGMVYPQGECTTRLLSDKEYKKKSSKSSRHLSILSEGSIYRDVSMVGQGNKWSTTEYNLYKKEDGTIRQITRAVPKITEKDNTHIHIKVQEVKVYESQPYNALSIDGDVHTYIVGDACLPVHNTGKSYLCLYMAVCAALRRDFFGKTTTYFKTLYIDMEATSGKLNNRMHRIANELNVPFSFLAENIHWYKPEGSVASEQEILASFVEKNNYGAVIIDAGASASGNSPMDEQAVLKFFTALEHLPCAKLIIHHEPKGVNGIADDKAYYGTTFWRNAPRLAWRLKRLQKDGNKSIIQAIHHKANDDLESKPITYSMDFSAPDDIPKVIFARQDDFELNDDQKIVNYLLEGEADLDDIMNATGVKRGTLQNRIDELIKSGHIERKRSGKKYVYYVEQTGTL